MRDGNPGRIFVRDGEEQGASFSLESVNVVLHQRRTRILRQKLRSLRKREETAITIYEPKLIGSSSFPSLIVDDGFMFLHTALRRL